MKKYLIVGVAIAVIAVLVCFALKEEASASLKTAFYGSALSGRTVEACTWPDPALCFEDVASAENEYEIKLPHYMAGWYRIDDGTGCCPHVVYWNGRNPVNVDFCVPPPPCNCC
ncbi:MAG: hypothetical protein JSV10_03035 [Candidatus Zixiibacteriota bacterium]|nr:MAG: hypothetical protein JSV10_03035 [candidate division Zixibacteria bacterium]